MNKMIRFTEQYYDDAERLALYVAGRDGCEIFAERKPSDIFPVAPKLKVMPKDVNVLCVGNYEIAYLGHREYPDQDKKYKNRTLHRVLLGDRLKEVRESRGMTLEELGTLTGLRPKNIENIEAGRFDVTIDILGNIGDALGCHVDFAFDD